jgi:hypothetical protein
MPTNPYDKINSRYESELQRALNLSLLQVRGLYEDAILELSFYAATLKAKEKPFALSLYPALNEQVEAKLRGLHKSLLRLITANQKAAWALSNLKNTEIVDRRLAGKKPASKARQLLYDPNSQALEAFLSRKEQGLELSDRVWNLLEPFKHELEQGLGLGISEGKPARKMATQMKQYLREPDKLFRRVRGKDGKLRLSKAAREYKPGQGVYRSSYKNALRLTRTETQMSYQNSDHLRWRQLPFIVGIEVRLSNRHVTFDQCDHLKGRYPKTFHFNAWHPQCLCSAIPIMATDSQYEGIEDAILEGREVPQIEGVKDMPADAKKWISDNADRIKRWKNTPLFIKNNQDFVKGLLKK